MSRHNLEGGVVWFGTTDAPAPLGIETSVTPKITVGVSSTYDDPFVHVRYRRRDGAWQKLQLKHVRRNADARFFEAAFPSLPTGTRIDYEVYFRCGGREPKAECRVGEIGSFEIQPESGAKAPPAPTSSSESRSRTATRDVFDEVVQRVAAILRNVESDPKVKLDLARDALTLVANDEEAASRLVHLFERQGVRKLDDLRVLSLDDLTHLLGGVGLRTSIARERAQDLRARFLEVASRATTAVSAPSVPLQKHDDSPRKAPPRTSAIPERSLISGAVVRPRGFARLETIEIRAYKDPDLEHELGRARCDSSGRFSIPVPLSAEGFPLWIRWIAVETSGRSPIFEPRIPGQALRIYPYRLAVHPGSSGHLARRHGRVLASTGRAVSHARVWLVEHALRSCQYLTSTATREDGYFDLAFPLDALIDPQRPDLRFVVFGGPQRPLLASESSALVLPVETVNARSLFDDVGDAMRRYVDEAAPDLALEEASYLESRTGLSAQAILAYQKAQRVAAATGTQPVKAFAMLSAPRTDDLELFLVESVQRGIVPRVALAAVGDEKPPSEQLRDIVTTLATTGGGIETLIAEEVGSLQKVSKVLDDWKRADSSLEFEDRLKADTELRPKSRLIRRALEVAEVVPGYPELVSSLCKCVADDAPEALATWSPTKWREHLRNEGITPPAHFGFGEDGVRAFAGHVTKTFSARYPAKVVRSLLEEQEPQLAKSIGEGQKATRAQTLFGKVSSPSRKNQSRKLREVESLLAMCREVTPTKRLLEEGIKNARTMSRMGRREFTTKFADAFAGGELDAAVAHSRAKRASALGNYAFLALSSEGTKARGLPSPELKGKQRERASEAIGVRDAKELDSTWEELSGSFGRSFCECVHCRSIFGPAAYLFDMLLFLARFTGEPGYHAPSTPLLYTLMERRPDIPRLHLSCNNTNIEVPQIDLVNELLSDLIAVSVLEPMREAPSGNSCDDGAIKGPIECAAPAVRAAVPADERRTAEVQESDDRFRCASPERHTQGSSQERRAIPQSEPPPSVLSRLTNAAFPWVLPYDYQRDKASEALKALPVDRAEVALAVWRFRDAKSENGDTSALADLGRHFLDLSAAQRALLKTSPYSLADVWGQDVAASVINGAGPTLESLRRVGDLDFAGLDAALTTHFVSGDGERAYELVPESSCDTEEIRLVAERSILCGILDRLHRFERLRRNLGWSATLLDDVLQWLGGTLDDAALNAIGVLKFLEARLNIASPTIVAFFHDPSPVKRARLLSGKQHKSSFEELLGEPGTEFPLPVTSDPVLGADVTVSIVSALTGEGPDEVRFVLAQGYANAGGEALEDPASILSSADPRAALRRAAVATYRVARFARAIGFSLPDLVHVLTTFEVDPFPWDGNVIDAGKQLLHAVHLLALAEEARTWHLDPVDVRYVATFNAAIHRSQGLDPHVVGQIWLELLGALAEAGNKRKTESRTGRELLHHLLGELLKPASWDALTSGLSSTLARIGELLSWQALVPDLFEQASRLLPSDISSSAFPSVEAPAESPWAVLAGFLAGLIEREFADDATRDDEPTVECDCPPVGEDGTGATRDTDNETEGESPAILVHVDTSAYIVAEHEFMNAVEQMLRSPNDFDAEPLATSLEGLLSSLGIRIERAIALEVVKRYVRLGFEQAASVHESTLAAHAQRWADLLATVLRRSGAEEAVVSALARLCSAEEDAVRLFLEVLHEPGNEAPLLRAFVDDTGSLPRIIGSLPVARYSRKTTTTARARNAAWERREPSLQFDWTSVAPPDGLDANDFAVEIEVAVPIERLMNAEGVVRLVIETTGTAALSLVGVARTETVVTVVGSGKLERADANTMLVQSFLIASGENSEDAIVLRLTYETAPTPAPAVLRLFARDANGDLASVWAGDLDKAMLLLHKATRAAGQAGFPHQVLTALSGSPFRVDLNAIPLGADTQTWASAWSCLSALRTLWARRASDEQWPAMLSVANASPIPVSDEIRELLGLSHAEFEGLKRLFGPSTGLHTTPGSIAPALALSSIARRTALPINVLLDWYETQPEVQFAQAVGALRAHQRDGEWLEALTTIYNPVRERLRDALLAWLTTHRRTFTSTKFKSHRPLQETMPPFESEETVSDFLFTDVQISSCLQTSRVQFSYAAVQRCIDAMRMGFEDGPQPAEQARFEREWSWRRMYRLWEANRRVFVHPENWLEPDLRPEKTELFQQFEDDLMSAPLTSPSAEKALVGYVTKLAALARPEVIAIVEQPEAPDLHLPYGFRDPDLAGTHVFARSRTQPRKFYYRRRYPLPDGRWTPWEELPAELPGTHFLAVVAFGRVRIIAAQVDPASPKRGTKCPDIAGPRVGLPEAGGPQPETEITISWIDRKHGEWSKPEHARRFRVQTRMTAVVDIADAWEAFPHDQYPPLQQNLDLMNQVEVKIRFGSDGVDGGSRLDILLKTDEGDKEVRKFTPSANFDDQTLTVTKSLSGLVAVSKVTGLRLNWYPKDIAGIQYDDAYVRSIVVKFSGGNPHRSWSHTVTSGWRGPDANNCRQETTRGYFELTSGGVWQDGFGHDEPQFRCFETNLNLSTRSYPPDPSQFDWRPLPKHHSVDLGQAISLRVANQSADSFDIAVQVNEMTFDVGEAAIAFKLKSAVKQDVPEAKDWPQEWKDGADICAPLRTHKEDAIALRVFADGSISSVSTTTGSTSGYAGTRFRGQQLVSLAKCDSGPSWATAYFSFYCSETRAVSAPICYQVVVPWDESVSSFVNPKVLDENSAEAQLGRTFFVERVFEESTPTKGSVGTKQCFEVPVFVNDEVQPDRPVANAGPVKGLSDKLDPLIQFYPEWHMGTAVGFVEVPPPLGDAIMVKAPVRQARMLARDGGFVQSGGIDKALSLDLGGLVFDALRDKKFKIDVVCVPAETAMALKSVQKVALSNDIRATEGQMMVAASGQKGGLVKKWAFRTFWHPQAIGFLRVAEGRGTPRMLAYGNQALDASTDLTVERSRQSFFASYNPSNIVSNDWPEATVDFSVDGAYADYNWELFYHAPLMIAQRLSEAGRFEDAELWFRLLFDPSMGRLANDPDAAYQTFPLRHAEEERVEDMLRLLEDGILREEFAKQVDRLNRYPYQPHLIARHRVSAYKKALFMRYLDHLIAWGDALFRRAYASDNRTDLETASSRYDLVAKLLGDRPDSLPDRTGGSVGCFVSLVFGSGVANADDSRLWDPVARFAELIDGSLAPSDPVANDGEGIPELYFCVPHNDKLLTYWDTLAERLSNLRTCRDIEGVERTLSLYGRRIDPGLLVRATAQGLDIDVLLGYLAAPLPRFRFNAMLQRAREAADRAGGFGQSLLFAIEKRESEELARLRSGQELAILRAAKTVRDEQLQEAKESLEALNRSLDAAQSRLDFYSSREQISQKERAEGEALTVAGSLEQQASSEAATAADWAWVPNLEVSGEAGVQAEPPYYYARAGVGIRYSVGGDTGVKVHQNKAEGLRNDAAAERAKAAQVGRQAGYDRRWEDWELQAELARKDIQQIARQITAAEIRIAIAEIERDNQQLQIENAQAVDAFLRDKFTNVQLYRWMESRLSRLYYQQYSLAYDLAQKAQKALHYELGLEDVPPIPDGWDARNRGMEAATALQHELQKLQQTHLDAWRREHQKTKLFSLRERQPLAFLEVRQTGSCMFEIREMDLDEDEPGDYFRRIKAVFVDIPCVRGPDVSVNARLTLLRSTVRMRAHRAGDSRYPRAEGAEGAEDERFRDVPGGIDHIVTSSGVNDAGVFEPNLNDETWLPFEGAGVVSTWRLDLPLETNHFDRATLSDVKLRILYTSRAGSNAARAAAFEARAANLADRPQPVMFDLKSWAPDEWQRFLQGGEDGHQLGLLQTPDDLPHALRGGRIVGTDIYFEMRDGEELRIAGGDSVGRVRVEDVLTRLTLRSPLVPLERQRVRLLDRSGIPHRADLLLWVRASVRRN